VDKFSTKLSRPIATGIVLGGMIVMIFAILLPILVISIKEVEQLIMTLMGKAEIIKSFILNKQFLGQPIVSMIDMPSMFTPVTNFTKEVVNQSISLTINIAQAVVYLLAIGIITYYFVVDKETIREGIMLLFPKHIKQKASTIITSISSKIGRYLIAQLTVIGCVGLCVMIPLMIMNIDCAILLGVLSAILDLIPVIGPTIALIICVTMCLNLGAIKVGLVIFFFILAQWIENNFVRPYVFGKFLDLHPLIIFFSLFVTAKFFGIIGVVFAPAIAATICVLLDELYIKPINKDYDEVAQNE
jgi:predicted PurR-regulated permease PerM